MADAKDKKKASLGEDLNNIAFRNEAIRTINALHNDNLRLKSQLGRNKRSSQESSAPKIRGLQGLSGDLGGQFIKKTTSND